MGGVCLLEVSVSRGSTAFSRKPCAFEIAESREIRLNNAKFYLFMKCIGLTPFNPIFHNHVNNICCYYFIETLGTVSLKLSAEAH